MGTDGTYRPVHDGAVQYAPVPADGDDYVYRIRTELTPMLTLAKRVVELEETVRVLASRVTALERRLGEAEGEM